MSSAILYLAIVAIWAFLLVPRWVRRAHATVSVGDRGSGEAARGLSDGLTDGTAGDPAETEGSRPGILRAVGLVGTLRPRVQVQGVSLRGGSPAGNDERYEDSYAGASYDSGSYGAGRGDLGSYGAGSYGAGSYGAGRDDPEPYDLGRGAGEEWPELAEPEPDTAPMAPVVLPPAPEPEPAGAPAGHGPEEAGTASGAPLLPGPSGPPPLGRAKILQARRRMLTTLALLLVAAASCTALGLTRPWVCAPPVGMLSVYLLLLREAAVADAEAASRRAHYASLARERARVRARHAEAARASHQGAEIIDISARLGDQLYDQYADATVRAVGD